MAEELCLASGQCAYLLKLNSSGTTLVYSTSLLGEDCGFDSTSNIDEGISFTAVAVDSTQHAYVLAIAGPGCYTTPRAYNKRNLIGHQSHGDEILTADASGALFRPTSAARIPLRFPVIAAPQLPLILEPRRVHRHNHEH